MIRYLLFQAVSVLLITAQPLPDWLVTTVSTPTELKAIGSGRFRLTNGLISREFSTTPDFATVDFFSHERNQSLLRAIRLFSADQLLIVAEKSAFHIIFLFFDFVQCLRISMH